VGFHVGTAGDVWWACDGEVGPPILVEYAPGVRGDAAPLATLALQPHDAPSFAVNASGTVYVSQSVASEWVTQVYPDIAKSSTPSETYTVDCALGCTVAAAQGTTGVFVTADLVKPAALIFYDLTGPSRELHQTRSVTGPKTKLDNPLSAALQ
jgi:hypothetical protein